MVSKRCEICGVPVTGDQVRCDRCVSRSDPPRHPVVTTLPMEQDEVGPEPERAQFSRPYLNTPTDDSRATGVVLERKYRLLNEIGRGAMGTVFLAEDLSLQRKVAIKFLLPELDSSAECAIRFQQEAVGMASVRDNNVAQIYSYAEHGDKLYFVMEYLDGESVEGLIDSHNRRGLFVPLNDALDILIQSASGLSAIHRAGVVHRDIKPANIMYAENGTRTVIMDFGLVRNVEIEHEIRTLVGTPAYMAPELAEGKAGSDRSPLTDIYSLGAAAYELLTGSLPFDGESWVEIIRKHIAEVPPFPSEKRPGLPDELDEVIFRALSKDPKERQQSCEELLDELYQIERMSLSDPAVLSAASRGHATTRVKRLTSRKPGVSITPSPTSTPPGSLKRGRLLVVDPDPGFRAKVHQVAKATVPGCRVYSATDGVMALKMFEEVRPSAMVIDLRLPEINGLEVTATLRGDAANDPVSIIVVTNQGGTREAEILKSLKVNRYLTKPIDEDTLANELRPVLERPLRSPRSLSSDPYV
jgi:eukaryotic-like serine/threonine-protein kinase